MVENVVTNTGAIVKEWGMLYKSVVQTVMIYGSKIWAVTGEMLKVLDGLHHQAARRIAGKTDRRTTSG